MTAHDLAADWSTWEHARGFTLGRRGRVVWESASYPEGGDMRTVRVSRFVVPDTNGPLLVRTVYVDPDTPVRLVIDYGGTRP